MGTVERDMGHMAHQSGLPHVTSYSTVATRHSTPSGSYLPADDDCVDDGIKRKGTLKKLKVISHFESMYSKSQVLKIDGLQTMKKKYFVLRKATSDQPAVLEYYDQLIKYQKGEAPKRTSIISGCFAVNKKEDSKVKNAISIFGNPDTFGIVAASEQEQMDWLRDLVELQQSGSPQKEDTQNSPTSSMPTDQPYFGNQLCTIPPLAKLIFLLLFPDYVWNVDVKPKKGAASQSSIVGPHRLCVQIRADEKKNRFVKLFPVTAPRPDQGGKEFPVNLFLELQ